MLHASYGHATRAAPAESTTLFMSNDSTCLPTLQYCMCSTSLDEQQAPDHSEPQQLVTFALQRLPNYRIAFSPSYFDCSAASTARLPSSSPVLERSASVHKLINYSNNIKTERTTRKIDDVEWSGVVAAYLPLST